FTLTCVPVGSNGPPKSVAISPGATAPAAKLAALAIVGAELRAGGGTEGAISLRTRPFALSAISRLPDASRQTSVGRFRAAIAAGPLSPEKSGAPVPAIVTGDPDTGTSTIWLCPLSAINRSPAESSARPPGLFRFCATMVIPPVGLISTTWFRPLSEIYRFPFGSAIAAAGWLTDATVVSTPALAFSTRLLPVSEI